MNKIKQYIEEREREFDRQFEETYNFYCENDVNGYITNSDDYIKQIDPDGIKDYNTQTIKGLLDVIGEEVKNNYSLASANARKVIVDDYNEATKRYKRAKKEVSEGKKYAEADRVSENAKQVALSRLESKITREINQALSDITTKLKTINKQYEKRKNNI